MSRKLNRRQLRQQEELEQLRSVAGEGAEQEQAAPPAADESEAEDEAEERPAPSATGFAALQAEEPDEGAEQEEEERAEQDADAPPAATGAAKKKKNKKNKKKKAAAKKEEAGAEEPAPEPAPARSKASRKKAGKGAPKTTDVNAMSIDEISEVLASSSIDTPGGARNDAPSGPACGSQSPAQTLRGSLALDAPNLDPAVELRRQFGAAAIKALEREKGGSAPVTRSGARRGGAYNSNMWARTVLSTPKPTWPDLGRTFVGLAMSTNETERGRVCNFEHSRAYRQAQLQFAQAVNSYDANSLVALFRVFPWHIDTLLQLADISRYQGDLGQAGDFIERALFAMERSAAPAFVSGLTASSGPPMLDFDRVENRAFWLAVHRSVDLLGRRGTWRTALEWCKLLLALDTADPHGAMLWIDFLAIKSRQHTWFLRFLDAYEAARAKSTEAAGSLDNVRARTPLDGEKSRAQEEWSGALDWSVGACFGRALALRAQEHDEGDKTGERSTAALRLALARHPTVLPLLYSKLDVPVPEEVAKSANCQLREQWGSRDDAFDELLAHLYVHRSNSLWKEPPTLAWLKRTVDEVVPQLVRGKLSRGSVDAETKMGVYRHTLVADLPESFNQQLLRYFPPEVRNPPGGVETHDPLPPAKGTRYDDAYFSSIHGWRERTQAMEMPGEGGSQLFDMLRRLNAINADDWQALLNQMDEETRDQFLGTLMADLAEGRDTGEDVGGAEAAGDDQRGQRDYEGETEEEDLDEDDGESATAHGDEGAGSEGLLQRAWNAIWGRPST